MKNQFIERVESLRSKICSLPWSDKNFYAEWVAQTYFYVNHSVSLLKVAAEHSQNREVRERFVEHISEESGHEKLCLNDLKFMGLKIEQFSELLITKEMYEKQYDIAKQNPTALIGYILALEILAAKILPEIMKTINQAHPISKAFARVHAEEDQDHITSAFDQFVYMNEYEIKSLQANFDDSLDRYINFLNSIYAVSSAKGTTLNVTNTPHASL